MLRLNIYTPDRREFYEIMSPACPKVGDLMDIPGQVAAFVVKEVMWVFSSTRTLEAVDIYTKKG